MLPNPDGVVGVGVFQRRLFLLGQNSIERWYNAGDADFALRRDYSWTVEIGCLARATIQSLPEGILFVGSDRVVYLVGDNFNRISNETVEEALKDVPVSSLIASSYTEDGHRFYVLSMGGSGAAWTAGSWVLDVMTGLWHERSIEAVSVVPLPGSAGADRVVAQLGQDTLLSFGREIGTHWVRDGNAVAAEAVQRELITPVVEANRATMSHDSFEMELPYREGGHRDDELVVDWTRDGGKTFSAARQRYLGLTGDADRPVPERFKFWRVGGKGRARNYRVRVTAQRRVDIVGGYIDIEVDDT